ncbi:putative oxidoreductase [Hoeflea marina]|uniref:Putative oxidoreductase n=1 Tax=Hoeflea marina TaxID=274592 RepID=A0A317PS72_9HYPH|nr:DoxX family protein [Hoeflea marina]PWW04313.1 putative oxidoreductase [Hoeflea marina]
MTRPPATGPDGNGATMVATARLAFGGFFVGSAVLKLMATATMVKMLGSAGFAHPLPWVWFAAASQFAGGMALIANRLVRWAAIGLIVYVTLVNVILHGFWNLSGDAASIQFQLFSKNLGIIAGLMGIGGAAGTWGMTRKEVHYA